VEIQRLCFPGALLVCVAIAFSSPAAAGHKVTPTTNKGNPWRMGYYEGGPYIDFQKNLRAVVKAMMEMGWITPQALPETMSSDDGLVLWRWLSENMQSDYLSFVPGAGYSANWEKEKRKSVSREVVERLAGRKDLDLVLAMGTWAGQDLANNRHEVPVMVMAMLE